MIVIEGFLLFPTENSAICKTLYKTNSIFYNVDMPLSPQVNVTAFCGSNFSYIHPDL